MKSTVLSALFILTFAGVPALAADGPASGVWKVTGSVAGNAVETTCTVKQDDKKLSGSCKGKDGVESALTGEAADKNVKWEFKRDFNGTEITLIFTGALDDKSSNISGGKINVQPFGVDGDFSAKKEEAKKEEVKKEETKPKQ